MGNRILRGLDIFHFFRNAPHLFAQDDGFALIRVTHPPTFVPTRSLLPSAAACCCVLLLVCG